MVSAGGALGGIFVAMVAPLVLPDFWEYHIGIAATVVLAFVIACCAMRRGHERREPFDFDRTGGAAPWRPARGRWGSARTTKRPTLGNNLETSRNFYGVLRVNEGDNSSELAMDRSGR